MKIGSKEELYDITEWDSYNWGKAIRFIDKQNLAISGKRVLELGSRNGGMSLFFANRGGYCTTSDLVAPGEAAKRKHKKWDVDDRIEYATVDATNMDCFCDNIFDIVTFKSIIGGIGANENIENEKKMVAEIHRVLKDDGYVVFIENMQASRLHSRLRSIFRKYGAAWHYQSEENINNLFCEFTRVCSQHYGVLGLFGINESARHFLGFVDSIIEPIVKDNHKYIGVYVFKKK